ncbi:MAG TPA: hypothetical protein VMH61_08940 [Candidatus Acidoferrales bacterium]|nr:hypothetical protein [Candidatus Acidoferrales bacterium]
MSHRKRKWHDFERRHEPLAPLPVLRQRLLHSAAVAGSLISVSLVIGVVGYHWIGGLRSWVDCLYNASMILGGMGPVDELKSRSAKVFASAYAIYSGVVLLASVGVMISPLLHRLLHRFHLATDEETKS